MFADTSLRKLISIQFQIWMKQTKMKSPHWSHPSFSPNTNFVSWSPRFLLFGKWKWSRSFVSDSLRPVDCSPPSSSIHGILKARILEWVAISFSRGPSQPRDRTSHIAGRRFNLCTTREAPFFNSPLTTGQVRYFMLYHKLFFIVLIPILTSCFYIY